MKKMEIGRYWWWLLLIVVLAGLGYYTYSQINRKPPERLDTKKVAPGKTKPLSQKQPTVAGEKKDILPSPAQEEPLAKTLPDKDDCTRIETKSCQMPAVQYAVDKVGWEITEITFGKDLEG